MNRAGILKKVSVAAQAYGFITGYYRDGKDLFIQPNGKPAYVRFTVYDKFDAERCDFTNGVIAGTVEVSAGICMMNSEMTPQELLEAAKQIQSAGMLMQKLNETELSYTEKVTGQGGNDNVLSNGI